MEDKTPELKLVYDGQKYIFYTRDWRDKDHPKSAGFRWNSETKQWWTSDHQKALSVSQFADEPTRNHLEAYSESVKTAQEASRAADAQIELPRPKGLNYLPYQKAGIQYAMSRPSTLIGDDMGLGKTIQGLGVINTDPSIQKVLIVCPASLKLNWAREAAKWLVRPMNTLVVTSKTKEAEAMAAQVLIVNYDILHKFITPKVSKKTKTESEPRLFDGLDFDLLIADEAHLCKNAKARRSASVFAAVARSKRKVFLTGTPIVNRPIELWPLINALDPNTFDNFFGYAQRYCAAHQTKFGWDFSGSSNLEELQEKLRGTIMVRRLKSQVLKDLPKKVRQVIALPAEGDALKAVQAESAAEAAEQEHIEALRLAVALAEVNEDKEAYAQAMRELNQAQLAAFERLSRMRHETALAKLPYVIEHLKMLTEEQEQKVICFVHHNDMARALMNEFGQSAVKITGEVSMTDRQAAVDRFQTDPTCKLFVGSIGAAGVGLTLTASSTVVFAELDWVPGNITQCEDRAHRIGQENSVLIQHLVLDGSIDARMAAVIVNKQEVIEKALDNQTNGQFNLEVKEAVEVKPLPELRSASGLSAEEIAQRQEAYRAQMEQWRQEREDKRVVRGMTGAEIREQAEKMSDRQRDAIHSCLSVLAGVCDGARDLDGVGFNGPDSRIGRQLGNSSEISKKEAVIGLQIIKKYRRQLGSMLDAALTE